MITATAIPRVFIFAEDEGRVAVAEDLKTEYSIEGAEIIRE
jgi:hypothetical protein